MQMLKIVGYSFYPTEKCRSWNINLWLPYLYPNSPPSHTVEKKLMTVCPEMYTRIFIGLFFAEAPSCKQPNYPTMVEEINILWYVYTMKYHPAVKMNELLPITHTQSAWIYLGAHCGPEEATNKRKCISILFSLHVFVFFTVSVL